MTPHIFNAEEYTLEEALERGLIDPIGEAIKAECDSEAPIFGGCILPIAGLFLSALFSIWLIYEAYTLLSNQFSN